MKRRTGLLEIGMAIMAGVLGPGLVVGEPDPAEVQRLMDHYIQQEEVEKKAAEQSKPKPAPKPAVDHDLIAWQSAEKCGKAACFRAYLKKHPRGQYSEMAKARLEGEEPRSSTRSLGGGRDSVPSFSCTGSLRPVESIICQDPALSKSDGILGSIYRDLRAALGKTDADALRNAQRAWIKQRDQLCPTSASDLSSADQFEYKASCLRLITDKRIAELRAILQAVAQP